MLVCSRTANRPLWLSQSEQREEWKNLEKVTQNHSKDFGLHGGHLRTLGRNMTSQKLDLSEVLDAELGIAYRGAMVDTGRFLRSYFSILKIKTGKAADGADSCKGVEIRSQVLGLLSSKFLSDIKVEMLSKGLDIQVI